MLLKVVNIHTNEIMQWA